MLTNSPLVAFTILLLVILTIPPLFERFKLPGLVGLLVAGVILGEQGLHLVNSDSESIKLFSDIGKIYLMFVAGLEIDLIEFQKTKDRSLTFGIATFAVPMIAGILVGLGFNFGWNEAILIGSLLASHTLLGYPIVDRLGVTANQAVAVTIGATIFTDIAALFVLAICVSIHLGAFSPLSLIWQITQLVIYCLVVLLGFKKVGKEYFRRTGDDESNQFLFVLFAVFLASVGAQIIHVDKIVGAFLAGLAINSVVGHSPVEEKVVFVGSTLFIPFFFVDMGLLLDLPVFFQTIQSDVFLMLAIVGGLIGSKFLAAVIPKLIYGYNWNETMTMWSLSLPQVAATLAAALTAFETVNSKGERLIDEPVLNSVIVLMLVTSLLGPLLTSQFAKKLPINNDNKLLEDDSNLTNTYPETSHIFTIVVPIFNPKTYPYLIEMAAKIAAYKSGVIVPLSITKAYLNMDEPQLKKSLQISRDMLNYASIISQEFNVVSNGKIRIDDDIAHGISRSAREENADLIIMGSSKVNRLQSRLFGNVIDSVFSSSHCPVAVMQLLNQPSLLRRILLPVKDISQSTVKRIIFAQSLAYSNQGSLCLVHICSYGTSRLQIVAFEEELARILSSRKLEVDSEIKTIMKNNVPNVVIQMATDYDLVILHSQRRHTVVGVNVSNITTELLQKLSCSVILFGETH